MKILWLIWILWFGLTFSFLGCDQIYDSIGGNFRGDLNEMATRLSSNARNLIEEAFKGINPDQMIDYHVHATGLGKGVGSLCPSGVIKDSDLYLNSMRFSWRHPLWKIKTEVLMSASKIQSKKSANEQYARRLLDLVHHIVWSGG